MKRIIGIIFLLLAAGLLSSCGFHGRNAERFAGYIDGFAVQISQSQLAEDGKPVGQRTNNDGYADRSSALPTSEQEGK